MSDLRKQPYHFGSPQEMRDHHRINMGVGPGDSNRTETNAASWSLFSFHDTAPFGRAGQDTINMSGGSDDCHFLKRLTENL